MWKIEQASPFFFLKNFMLILSFLILPSFKFGSSLGKGNLLWEICSWSLTINRSFRLWGSVADLKVFTENTNANNRWQRFSGLECAHQSLTTYFFAGKLELMPSFVFLIVLRCSSLNFSGNNALCWWSCS